MSKPKYEYYKSRDVEAFMINILEKTKKVTPLFDLKHGYRYPNVEDAVQLNASKTLDFLENLVIVDVLEKELYDMELRCPNCNSPNISVNYICSRCTSASIKKTILIEHNTCGYLGTVENLGEHLTCPKCRVQLKDSEYRNAGSIYECGQCNQQIETPFINHRCRECNEQFSFETAIYQPKYAYVPTKSTSLEMNQGIIYLRQVSSIFEKQGFTRDLDTKIVGESGVEYTFDLAFKGYNQKIFVDIIFTLNPIGEVSLLKNYGKVRDVQAVHENVDVYLIILPGLTSDAEAVAKSYQMNLVVSKNAVSALSQLTTVLADQGTTPRSLSERSTRAVASKPARVVTQPKPKKKFSLFKRRTKAPKKKVEKKEVEKKVEKKEVEKKVEKEEVKKKREFIYEL